MVRPLKINKEIIKTVVDAIRAGNYIETAAAYAGIHKDTLYEWLKRGAREKQRLKRKGARVRKTEILFVEFSDAVKKALAESEMHDVAIITNAAQKAWQAAAWRLERKHPERWGRRDHGKSKILQQGQEPLVVKVIRDDAIQTAKKAT